MGLMNSLGTDPPTTSLMNSYPLPGSLGSMRILACPYCPRPPVWRMYLPSASDLRRMVSRYATCGLPTLASTLYSRIMRSMMISTCHPPIPEMIVCPLSGSVFTRNVGLVLARIVLLHLLCSGVVNLHFIVLIKNVLLNRSSLRRP